MEKKTPLYETHLKYNAKMVPFGGFIMPVQYKSGIIKEHMAVRTSAGLFDVSHMGEFFVSGEEAFANMQNLVTNDLAGMEVGGIKYSPMLNDNGGVVDDLLIYKTKDDEYMLVVNAGNRPKDEEWIKSHLFGKAEFDDKSDSYGLLALQGPKSEAILKKLTNESDIPEKNYTFKADVNVGGVKALVSRTGYTGEDGFEFYINSDDTEKLWDLLMEAGEEFEIIPCGLGARDTLRLEASMPLYGHEMTDEITPLETGLRMFVKMDKGDFIGKKALEEKGTPKTKRIGLILKDKGIARENSKVFDGDTEVGITTSGTLLPYLNKAVCMALVTPESAEIGKTLIIDVRGRKLEAEIVKLPFYKR